ncbi:unnamed protein product [Paramecium octaurelia]|uniref:Uncharacterized protein n=1 Tax=Paramecium octaurelia TaxID=43137 RepID=A0A8S1X1T5_PAROT|nr:unnamed protein product [Paramecium octaurelia]
MQEKLFLLICKRPNDDQASQEQVQGLFQQLVQEQALKNRTGKIQLILLTGLKRLISWINIQIILRRRIN